MRLTGGVGTGCARLHRNHEKVQGYKQISGDLNAPEEVEGVTIVKSNGYRNSPAVF